MCLWRTVNSQISLCWSISYSYEKHLKLYNISMNNKGPCDMSHVTRKCVFGFKRTVKAQISLRIRAGWSAPSYSANRIAGHYRMLQWRVKILVRLCACVELIWICAFCACSETRFAWRDLYYAASLLDLVPRVKKKFFVLNSAKYEIFSANK